MPFSFFYICLGMKDMSVRCLEIFRGLLQHPSHMQRNFEADLYAVQKFLETGPLPGSEVGDDVVRLPFEVRGLFARLEEVAGKACGRGRGGASGRARHGNG